MLACSSCRRFVRDGSATCPFCGQGLSDVRSPLGGFMGVILGVTLAACGTPDDKDDGASSASASASEGESSSSATAGTNSTTDETVQPLYGPVTSGEESTTTGPETGGPLYGPVTTGESGTTGDESGTTDDGASSTGSESAGPLYGPATG